MKVKVSVTQEILYNSRHCPVGKNSTLTNCAIACAVREIFPLAKVQRFTIEVFGVDHQDEIRLPDLATQFIGSFDDAPPEVRVNMIPFSFSIDIPDSVINRIGLDEVNEILSKSLTLERV